MNTQLHDGIKVWKDGEFERHVRRYISADHNPANPTNGWQASVERTSPGTGAQGKIGIFNSSQLNIYMGVATSFRHDFALGSRAA